MEVTDKDVLFARGIFMVDKTNRRTALAVRLCYTDYMMNELNSEYKRNTSGNEEALARYAKNILDCQASSLTRLRAESGTFCLYRGKFPGNRDVIAIPVCAADEVHTDYALFFSDDKRFIRWSPGCYGFIADRKQYETFVSGCGTIKTVVLVESLDDMTVIMENLSENAQAETLVLADCWDDNDAYLQIWDVPEKYSRNRVVSHLLLCLENNNARLVAVINPRIDQTCYRGVLGDDCFRSNTRVEICPVPTPYQGEKIRSVKDFFTAGGSLEELRYLGQLAEQQKTDANVEDQFHEKVHASRRGLTPSERFYRFTSLRQNTARGNDLMSFLIRPKEITLIGNEAKNALMPLLMQVTFDWVFESGHEALVASAKDTREILSNREVSRVSGVPYDKLINPSRLEPDEFRLLRQHGEETALRLSRVHFLQGKSNADRLYQEARNIGAKLVVVDVVQNMSVKGADEFERIHQIMMRMLELTKLGVAVLFGATLRRPTHQDGKQSFDASRFRGSSDLENLADRCWILRQEKGKKGYSHILESDDQSIPLQFNSEFMRFEAPMATAPSEDAPVDSACRESEFDAEGGFADEMETVQ